METYDGPAWRLISTLCGESATRNLANRSMRIQDVYVGAVPIPQFIKNLKMQLENGRADERVSRGQASERAACVCEAVSVESVEKGARRLPLPAAVVCPPAGRRRRRLAITVVYDCKCGSEFFFFSTKMRRGPPLSFHPPKLGSLASGALSIAVRFRDRERKVSGRNIVTIRTYNREEHTSDELAPAIAVAAAVAAAFAAADRIARSQSFSGSECNPTYPMTKKKVAIVGSGNWGCAIAKIVGANAARHNHLNEEVIPFHTPTKPPPPRPPMSWVLACRAGVACAVAVPTARPARNCLR